MKTHLLNSVKALTVAALMTGGIAITTPAYAINTQADIITTKIDLRDLKTERGVERIYKSLSRRADSACKTPGPKPIENRVAENKCAKNLLIEFVQDVDNPRLTKYYIKMQS